MQPLAPTVGPRFSTRKKLAFLFIVGALAACLLEIGLRALFSLEVGPSVLFYGTSLHSQEAGGSQGRNVGAHRDARGGYSKYHPNQVRRDRDEDGRTFTVAINRHGFRGADFPVAREAGTVRVITLGASSTFGYHNRDHETYPYLLEGMLNERGAGARYEVLNLAIPHMTSSSIVSLFRHEVVPLAPDIATFYEGLNDTKPELSKAKRLASLALARAGRVLISMALLDSVLDSGYRRYGRDDLEQTIARCRATYLSNLTKLHEEARAHGIELIVIRQQSRSLAIPRSEIRGVSYEEEAERLERKLTLQGELSSRELQFLVHRDLMDGLADWASATGAWYVDAATALDGRRDTLITRVHLTREGNRLIAHTLAKAILSRAAPGQPTTPNG